MSVKIYHTSKNNSYSNILMLAINCLYMSITIVIPKVSRAMSHIDGDL